MPTKAPTFRSPTARTRADIHREHDAKRGNSAARGYGGSWRRLRKLVLAEVPVCQAPGCDALATEVDHITPLARGGTHARENLQSLCKPCHSRKTATEDRRPR